MGEIGDDHAQLWPSLAFAEWRDTCATLHLWTQVVGKIRLAQAPAVNHWWHVPLYVTCRGLTTSPMPHGARRFQIDFDFIGHRLVITASDGKSDGFPLAPPTPFEQDHVHAAYDRDHAERFWRILLQADRVLTIFRGRFVGKTSPVHFFWGSFDLAVTRFSGRAAPPHPGAPNVAGRVTREAYCEEVSSCGFWPGGAGMEEPVFYAYAYPTPPGFDTAVVRPETAFWSAAFGEFLLPYDAVRRALAPDETLLQFLQSTYEAAADLARWDRPRLERRVAR